MPWPEVSLERAQALAALIADKMQQQLSQGGRSGNSNQAAGHQPEGHSSAEPALLYSTCGNVPGPLSMMDDQQWYRITITTDGSLRATGDSNITIRMIGSQGSTQEMPLSVNFQKSVEKCHVSVFGHVDGLYGCQWKIKTLCR